MAQFEFVINTIALINLFNSLVAQASSHFTLLLLKVISKWHDVSRSFLEFIGLGGSGNSWVDLNEHDVCV